MGEGIKGGVWAPLGANPAFGPTEQGEQIGGGMNRFRTIPTPSIFFDTDPMGFFLESDGILTRN